MNESCCSSWLTHGSSNVTVRYPSKKYFVVYEPGGRLPGSQPPSMHLGTQPRILACWLACCCSPPPPQALSARAIRATNTPVANSTLSLLMTVPLAPLLSLGDVDVRYSRLHHWLPTPLGAHLQWDAVLGLCLLLGGSVPRLCGMAHPPNSVSLLLLGVA